MPRAEKFGSIFLNGVTWPAFIAVLGVNLSDSAGISIGCRTYENLGMEIAEVEGAGMGVGVLGHAFILDETKRLPNMGKRDGFRYDLNIENLLLY
jgi:hypothetical protein